MIINWDSLHNIQIFQKLSFTAKPSLDFKDSPQNPQRGIFLTCLKDNSDISYHTSIELTMEYKSNKYLMIHLLEFLSVLKVKL